MSDVKTPSPSDAASSSAGAHASKVRDAHDAGTHCVLSRNPADEDAIADISADASFPASDVPSHSVAGAGEPAPSSGYDAAEEAIIRRRSQIGERAYLIWQQEGRPDGRELDHWARAEREIDAPSPDRASAGDTES